MHEGVMLARFAGSDAERPCLCAPLHRFVLRRTLLQNVKAEMTFDQWLELMARFAPPPGAKSAAPAAAASKPGSKAKPAAAPAAAVPSAPAASVRFTGVYKSLDAYLEETIYPIAQRVWPGRW